MPHRSRKETLKYRQYIKQIDGCQFCTFKSNKPPVVGETEHFWIVKNIFPYSIWDEMEVVDHLMAVPKHHTDSLYSLSEKASEDYVKLIGSYENDGYSIYARAPSNKLKSVVHQHTHLIKTKTKRRRFMLYVRKPYIRIAK